MIPNTLATQLQTDLPERTGAGGRGIARNSLLTLTSHVTQLAAVVVFAPLTLHSLGTERLGALSLIWALCGYFAMLDLGLGSAVTHSVATILATGERHRVVSVFWSAMPVQFGFGILTSTILMASAPLLLAPMRIPGSLQDDVLGSLRVCAASIPLVFASAALTGLFQGANRFDITAAISVPTVIVTQAAPWLVALRTSRLTAIAAALLVTRLASTVASLGTAAMLFPGFFQFRRATFGNCIKMLRFGGWITISKLVNPLLTYADRFLIGALLPLSAIAQYTIPYEAVMRLSLLPQSIGTAAFPMMANLNATHDRHLLRGALIQMVNMLVCSMAIPVVAICGFGDSLMALWLGTDFAARSSRVLQVLACGLYINALAVLPYIALQASGRPDLTAKFHLIEVLPHLGLLFFFVRMYGITGAALAWSVRVTVDAVLVWWAALRLTGSSPKCFQREVQGAIGTLVAAGSVALLASNVRSAPPRLTITCLAVGIVAWLVAWRSLDGSARAWLQNCACSLVGQIGSHSDRNAIRYEAPFSKIFSPMNAPSAITPVPCLSSRAGRPRTALRGANDDHNYYSNVSAP